MPTFQNGLLSSAKPDLLAHTLTGCWSPSSFQIMDGFDLDSKQEHQPTLSKRNVSRPPRLDLSDSSSITFTIPLKPSPIVEEIYNSGIVWAAASRRGRRRLCREDTFSSLPFIEETSANEPVSMFGVFDGHGGHQIAQFASHRLPQIFLNRYRELEAPFEALESAFLETDRDILKSLERANSTAQSPEKTSQKISSGSEFVSVRNVRGICAVDAPSLPRQKSNSMSKAIRPLSSDDDFRSSASEKAIVGTGSNFCDFESPHSRSHEHHSETPDTLTRACGTTATIAILIGKDFYVAHVGDTRAVLAKSGGLAVRLIEDHRPGREDEAERIEAAGGLVVDCSGTSRVDGVLAVSRAIGDPELKDYVIAKPDITKTVLSGSEEFIVIASDGIWDHLSDQECINLIREGAMMSDVENCESEEIAAKLLVQSAVDKGSSDDVTALIINLQKYFEVLQQERDGDNDPRVEEIIEEVNYEKYVSGEGRKDIEIESMTPASCSLQTSRSKRVSQW